MPQACFIAGKIYNICGVFLVLLQRVCYVFFVLVSWVLQLHIINELLCSTSTLALADNLGHLELCVVLSLASMDAGVCSIACLCVIRAY